MYSCCYAEFLWKYKGHESYNPDFVYDNPMHVFDDSFNMLIGAIFYAEQSQDEEHPIIEEALVDLFRQLKTLSIGCPMAKLPEDIRNRLPSD